MHTNLTYKSIKTADSVLLEVSQRGFSVGEHRFAMSMTAILPSYLYLVHFTAFCWQRKWR
ncbi:hypothetical protein J6590_005797 [Homalodisca vitripennis]|nr:hypothetical protein J6590_005797 [Homalodisca vitripennis]